MNRGRASTLPLEKPHAWTGANRLQARCPGRKALKCVFNAKEVLLHASELLATPGDFLARAPDLGEELIAEFGARGVVHETDKYADGGEGQQAEVAEPTRKAEHVDVLFCVLSIATRRPRRRR